MVLETNSYQQDALIRNDKGKSVGRMILVNSASYKKGAEFFNVAVLKVLKYYCTNVLGYEFYIDGVKYKIPSDLNKLKIRSITKEIIVTNFILKRV